MSLSNSGDNIARPVNWQNAQPPQQQVSPEDAQKLGAAVFRKAAHPPAHTPMSSILGMHEIAYIPSIADIRIISDPNRFQFALFIGEKTGEGTLFQFAYKNDFFSLKRVQDVTDFDQPTQEQSLTSFSPEAAVRYLSVVGRTASLYSKINNSPRSKRSQFSVLFNAAYVRPDDHTPPDMTNIDYLTSVPDAAPEQDSAPPDPSTPAEETTAADDATISEAASQSRLKLVSSQPLRKSPPAQPDLSLV